MRLRHRLGLAAGIALVCALQACGGDGGPTGNTTIDQQQATAVGTQVTGQISGLVGDISNFTFDASGIGLGYFAPPAAAARMEAALRSHVFLSVQERARLRGARQNCNPTHSDPNQTDTDGDGIPDDDIITFTAQNCTDIDPNTGDETVLTGSVHFQDQGSIFGFSITFDHLNLSFTSGQGQGDFALALNGTYATDVSAAAATALENFDLALTVMTPSQPTVSVNVHAGLDLSFTPNGTIVYGDLPSGTFNLNGDFSFDAGGSDSFSFSLDTPTPLAFDANCGLDPPFTAGEVHALITVNTSAGVSVTYTGCGVQPTVTVLGGAA